jgi:hypothetical protein
MSGSMVVNVALLLCKGVPMAKDSGPIELRPRATPDGRVDVAGVRWTIEHMHGELAEKPELSRVRNALAIALMELDRTEQRDAALSAHGLGWSRYLPWPKRG